MLTILHFIMRLLNTAQHRANTAPAVATIRRQLNEIEGQLHLQMGMRYNAYSISNADARNARLDEIADTIRTLRDNRAALRKQLGCTYEDFSNSCCAA